MQYSQTEPTNKSHLLWFFFGIACGSLTTFLLDPVRGHTRRALLKEKTLRLVHNAGEASEKIGRHLHNKTIGLYAQITRKQSENIDDKTLIERIRSVLGRKVTHPKSIIVEAHNGEVTLFGKILVHELDDLLASVKKVVGVIDITN